METYHKRDDCRGCGSKDLLCFFKMDSVPLAGAYLSSEQEIENEVLIPMNVIYCRKCGLVQIPEVIDHDVLFKEYNYLSSVNPPLMKHFASYATELKETWLKESGSSLLEFGCNDGPLLVNLGDRKAVGVDPSENVSKVAREKGLNVITSYFDRKSAQELVNEQGQFDVITGSNVFAHTDDIHEIIEAAKITMKPEGVFIVEVHSLKVLLDIFQYDFIYHEHTCYYSVTALQNIFAIAGLKVIDVKDLPIHGGSIRVTAARKESSHKVDSSVQEHISAEKAITEEFLLSFGAKCEEHRDELKSIVSKANSEGKKVWGYGARGALLLHYCGFTPRDVEKFVDVSPLRQGKMMPGTHIPIVPVEEGRENPPDYYLLMAWNYKESIFQQEEELRKKGVKFIIPFPELKIE